MFASIEKSLRYWESTTPSSPAWWFVERNVLRYLTWKEIAQAVDDAKAVFEGLAIRQGDRVISLVPNCLSWLTIDFACQALGAIHVPIDLRNPPDIVLQMVSMVHPSLALIHSSIDDQRLGRLSVGRYLKIDSCWPRSEGEYHVNRVASEPSKRDEPAVNTDDVATILFTSGTTRQPKGVMLTHENLVTNAMGKLKAMPQSSGDRRLNILPFAHAYARTCELSTWALSGSSLFVVESLDQIEKYAPLLEPTLFNGVPYVYQKLLSKAIQSPKRADGVVELASPDCHSLQLLLYMRRVFGCRLRMVASGGAGLSAELFKSFATIGLPIHQGYGLTETSPVVCSNVYVPGFYQEACQLIRNTEGLCNGMELVVDQLIGKDSMASDPIYQQQCLHMVGKVGRPIENVEVRIDANQHLFVRGPNVMKGYWEPAFNSLECIDESWLDTGDLATISDDGAVRILGRYDDRIVLSTGYKLDPWHVESILKQDKRIDQVCLVGNDRPYVIGIVSVETGTSSDELERLHIDWQAILKQHSVQEYAVPRRWIVTTDSWTERNGFLNHKGSLLRCKIEFHYASKVSELYSA